MTKHGCARSSFYDVGGTNSWNDALETIIAGGRQRIPHFGGSMMQIVDGI